MDATQGYCFEQIFEAVPYKTAAVRPFTPPHPRFENHPKNDEQDMLVTAEKVRVN